jgi:peptidoglycan/LPS O-acetylase OafA/YrhL
MKKIWDLFVELLKKLLPAARKDPVAAALGILVILAEVVTLSEWEFRWITSFTAFDVIGPVLLLLFFWRLYRRAWSAPPLGLAVAILLFVVLVFFSYSVPFKRLSITLAEFLVAIFLVVKDYP